MSNTRSILLKLSNNDVKSVTFDIFDTVLLRKIHPEEMQFLEVAKQWVPLFNKVVSDKIEANELLSTRIYARKELWNINSKYNTRGASDKDPLLSLYVYDVTLEEWFALIVDLLVEKYNKKINQEAKDSLVASMIDAEIKTEKRELFPNEPLIEAVRKARQNNPQLKVYFVSDMYLSKRYILDLLHHFGIDIFDDGIVSTDVGCIKANGGLFSYLHNKKVFGDSFDLSTNIHIGDSRTSDYLMPIANGSDAILYRPNDRKFYANRLRRKILAKQSASEAKKELANKIKSYPSNPAGIWRMYGFIFSQALCSFLAHVALSAKYSPNTTFLMVSSEAKCFKEYGDKLMGKLFDQQNIVIADKLNRRQMIKAFVWFLANNPTIDYDIDSIFSIICYGEVEGTHRELYEFFFGKDYPYSELTINHQNDKDFRKSFLYNIAHADSKYTKHLKEAYDYVISIIPSLKHKVAIVDLGWGGTVQMLFTDFCRLYNANLDITGLYLGAHPADRFEMKDTDLYGYLMPNVRTGEDRRIWNAVLWEYAFTNKAQFSEDTAHLEQIRLGILDGIAFIENINLNPLDYYYSAVRAAIKNFITRPKRKVVKIIGNIQFDSGFVDFHYFRIVDMSYSFFSFRKKLLLHPRSTIRNDIFGPNHWPMGYIAYYRLYITKLAIKLIQIIKRKTYF